MDLHGAFVWNELMTRDVEAAKAFYAATLGWSYDAMPMAGGGTYWLAKRGGTLAAGIMDMNAPEFQSMRPHWFAYIEVDDVDVRVAEAQTIGGTLLRPAFDVEGVGRIAIVQDPSGAVIGWMTSAPPAP
jgi:uncharacterized protein